MTNYSGSKRESIDSFVKEHGLNILEAVGIGEQTEKEPSKFREIGLKLLIDSCIDMEKNLVSFQIAVNVMLENGQITPKEHEDLMNRTKELFDRTAWMRDRILKMTSKDTQESFKTLNPQSSDQNQKP